MRLTGIAAHSKLRSESLQTSLENAYEEMARDESREAEAVEWSEAFLENIAGDELGVAACVKTVPAPPL